MYTSYQNAPTSSCSNGQQANNEAKNSMYRILQDFFRVNFANNLQNNANFLCSTLKSQELNQEWHSLQKLFYISLKIAKFCLMENGSDLTPKDYESHDVDLKNALQFIK